MPEKIRKAYPLTPVRNSKYHAKRSGKYASEREAKRAWELRLLQNSGEIFDLQEQVVFDLLPSAPELGYPMPLRYIADFVYLKPVGLADMKMRVTEDSKGVRTDVYILKKRLMKQLLGIEITEV